MCDTFVALGPATRDGSVIFGKNSDREPNEAHEVVQYAAADHADGAALRCTYLEIPQVAHTHAVLLAKPYWIWGAEMGANEHGVVIGNEAVFTRLAYQTAPGLIGMDLLRLGLERAASAEEALYVMTALLEQYGQGGNCGLTHPFYYHNSFLIADPTTAWVLETAGKEWAAQQVRGYRSISNQITIGTEWDLASADLVRVAVERGWCKGRQDFDFSRCYSDFVYTRFSAAAGRRACTTRLLETHRGEITPAAAMRFLRSHGGAAGENAGWRPDAALLGADVCMHAAFGPARGSQSTGSLVAHLNAENPEVSTYWVTGTSAPCTSIFKPLWLGQAIPWQEPSPRAQFDAACLWWRHEALHRSVLLDYPSRAALFREERDALEISFIAGAARLADAGARREYAQACFQAAEEAEAEWLARVTAVAVQTPNRFYFAHAWDGYNQQARMTKSGAPAAAPARLQNRNPDDLAPSSKED